MLCVRVIGVAIVAVRAEDAALDAAWVVTSHSRMDRGRGGRGGLEDAALDAAWVGMSRSRMSHVR